MTYIRVTGHLNEIPILNTNSSIGYFSQLNEVSFIYTICFLSVYRSFGIHSVISLLLTKTFNTFTYTKKYNYDDYEPQDILVN